MSTRHRTDPIDHAAATSVERLDRLLEPYNCLDLGRALAAAFSCTARVPASRVRHSRSGLNKAVDSGRLAQLRARALPFNLLVRLQLPWLTFGCRQQGHRNVWRTFQAP